MVLYKVLLTKPLAAGPEGDWTQDVLMEAKPVMDFPLSSTDARTSEEADGDRANGVAESAFEYSDIEEVSVSDDDENDNNESEDGGDEESDASKEVPSQLASTAREDGHSVSGQEEIVGGCSRDGELDVKDVFVQASQVTSKITLSDVGGNGDGTISSDSEDGKRDSRRVAESLNTVNPSSPPRHAQITREDTTSPGAESVDIEEDRASDSSFNGADDDDGFSSDDSQDRDDSDGYEPDVPYPPCSLHHQDRKTYKQSLCKECYMKYKHDLEAAGLYRGSDEEPGPARRRRKRGGSKRKKTEKGGGSTARHGVRGGRERRSSVKDGNAASNQPKKRKQSNTVISAGHGRAKRRRDGASNSSGQQTAHASKKTSSVAVDSCDQEELSSDGISQDLSAETIAVANVAARKHLIQSSNLQSRTKIGEEHTAKRRADEGGTSVNLPVSGTIAPTVSTLNPCARTDGIAESGNKTAGIETLSGVGLSANATGGTAEPVDARGGHPLGLSAKASSSGLSDPPQRKFADTPVQPNGSNAHRGTRRAHLQLERGNSLDATTREVGRAGGPRIDEKLTNVSGSLASNAHAHLNMRVPAGGGIGKPEKRKSGVVSNVRTGKKTRTSASGDGAVPTSRAAYERVAHYTGVVRKVTNGRYFLWVGDKLHDGKPYDSAEDCAREYDKLQPQTQRGGPFRPRLNFGDAKAPSHVETMGLTALSSEPGSRMAKKIQSGYRVANVPVPLRARRKQGGPFFAPLQARAGKLQQQPLRAASSIPPPEISPSNNLNIDLPMLRSNREGVEGSPSFSLPDGYKIRWLSPISSDERPLDGLHLPGPSSAVPRRSAMQGGRQSFRAVSIDPKASVPLAIASKTNTEQADEDVVNDVGLNRAHEDAAEGEPSEPAVTDVAESPMLNESCSTAMDCANSSTGGPPAYTSAQNGAPARRAESVSLSSSTSTASTKAAGTFRVPENAAVQPVGTRGNSECNDGVGGDAALAARPSSEVACPSELENDEEQSVTRPPNDGIFTDHSLSGMICEDPSMSNTSRATRAGAVPLRDHLAQMRHKAATQVSEAPRLGQAGGKHGGRSSAEERGQEALLRWMDQGTEYDKRKPRTDVRNHSSVQATEETGSRKASDHAAVDECNQVSEVVPPAMTASESGGGPDPTDGSSTDDDVADDDEDEDDLTEFENLCTKIAEMTRNVGALPPAVTPTETLKMDVAESAPPAPPAPRALAQLQESTTTSHEVIVHKVPGANDVLAQDGESDPKSPVVVTPQASQQLVKNCAVPTIDTTRDGQGAAQEGPVNAGDFVHHSPSSSAVAVAAAPIVAADTNIENEKSEPQSTEPSSPITPLGPQAAENTATGVCPPKPQIAWAPPGRFRRTKPVATPEEFPPSEAALIPRVSWRRPARLSRSHSSGTHAAPHASATVRPVQPRRVEWVAPRALTAIPSTSQRDATDARNAKSSSREAVILTPNGTTPHKVQGSPVHELPPKSVSIAEERTDVLPSMPSPPPVHGQREEATTQREQRESPRKPRPDRRAVVDSSGGDRSKEKTKKDRGTKIERGSEVSCRRSNSRSTDSRRSSSSRHHAGAESSTISRHHRSSSREKRRHRHRSPDIASDHHSPVREESSRGSRDSERRVSSKTASRREEDGARNRDRDRRSLSRNSYHRDELSRGKDSRKQSHAYHDHNKDSVDRHTDRGSSRDFSDRRSNHQRRDGQPSRDAGDWAGRIPRKERSSSRDGRRR